MKILKMIPSMMTFFALVGVAIYFTFLPESILHPQLHRSDTIIFERIHPVHSGSNCYTSYNIPQYIPSEMTMRPLNEFKLYQPSFYSLMDEIDSMPNGDILEIGCGSGRALLDLKSKYPNIRAVGTNYRGYGFSQTNGSALHLWSVAKHFNISVVCSEDGAPAFPEIKEAEGIQHPNYTSIFGLQQFDLIISRHALNQGKLSPDKSVFIVPRVVSLLKVGGTAMVHLLYGAFYESSSHAHYPVLSITNIGPLSASVSIILYHTRCYVENCVSALIRRCAPHASRHPLHGDCILPQHVKVQLPPSGWMLSEMAKVAEREPKERKAWRRYPLEYPLGTSGLAFALTQTHSLSSTHAFSLTHTRILSLFHTRILSQTYRHAFCHTDTFFSHTHTFSLTHTRILSKTHSLTHSQQTHAFSLSHTHCIFSHSHTRNLSHTYTSSYFSLSHTRTFSLTHRYPLEYLTHWARAVDQWERSGHVFAPPDVGGV
jgi:SAM-dependent methyltransferase